MRTFGIKEIIELRNAMDIRYLQILTLDVGCWKMMESFRCPAANADKKDVIIWQKI